MKTFGIALLLLVLPLASFVSAEWVLCGTGAAATSTFGPDFVIVETGLTEAEAQELYDSLNGKQEALWEAIQGALHGEDVFPNLTCAPCAFPGQCEKKVHAVYGGIATLQPIMAELYPGGPWYVAIIVVTQFQIAMSCTPCFED